MSMYKTQQPETAKLPVKDNCAGCGRALEQVRDEPGHQPEPNAAESDRCTSHPRKYSKLRCMFAASHTCVHTAKVAGTGIHFWRDEQAA